MAARPAGTPHPARVKAAGTSRAIASCPEDAIVLVEEPPA
jgi:hypothetical protein